MKYRNTYLNHVKTIQLGFGINQKFHFRSLSKTSSGGRRSLPFSDFQFNELVIPVFLWCNSCKVTLSFGFYARISSLKPVSLVWLTMQLTFIWNEFFSGFLACNSMKTHCKYRHSPFYLIQLSSVRQTNGYILLWFYA